MRTVTAPSWMPLLMLSLVVQCLPPEPRCPLLRSSHGIVTFFMREKQSPCWGGCRSGAIARLSCHDLRSPDGSDSALCLTNGSWSPSYLRCVPVCGKTYSGVSLIINAPSAVPGAYPWHVAIYNNYNMENKLEFWCGGTLISEWAVLTAAHCTWKVKAENLVLAFGKFYREIESKEPHVQVLGARDIRTPDSYQDSTGNYNGDISVIFLEKPVEINEFTIPVCLDWNQSHVDSHLREGSLGTVLGWGLTENESFSDHLRVAKLPVASDVKCITEQKNDFRKFVTFTSFCAGFLNGTGVCNGDSGGGLAFLDDNTDRWYLQGLVSVSPRRRGTPFCDPNYYTVFTKVTLFIKWLEKERVLDDRGGSQFKTVTVKESVPEKPNDPYAFIRHHFEKALKSEHHKTLTGFPHTKKMEDLATKKG